MERQFSLRDRRRMSPDRRQMSRSLRDRHRMLQDRRRMWRSWRDRRRTLRAHRRMSPDRSLVPYLADVPIPAATLRSRTVSSLFLASIYPQYLCVVTGGR